MRRTAICLLVSVLSLLSSLAEARVTRIEITTREIVADGMAFGDTGPYEKLRGTVYFAVDPDDSRNAVVFDLDKAPRNAHGLVEFSADFYILKPVDMTRGNETLLVEAPNRGLKNGLRLMLDVVPTTNDPTRPEDFGNGFLLRQGYTLAWVGWEADVLPGANRLVAQFPVARHDEEPISERILVEFSDAKGASTADVFTLPLSGNAIVKSYEAVSTNQAMAMAELRMRPSDSPRPSDPDIPEGELMSRSEWSFARCPDGPPGTPSATDICLTEGFRNDRVYELRYQAKNPTVMGLGFATTRDFISFLRHARADDGHPNPVPGITSVLGQGLSRSGQYFLDFLYQGFNEDTTGRRVFDGVNLDVGGANKIFLNYRFAQPNVFSSQHAGRYVPDTNFPRTYAVRQDPLDPRRMDGILKRPATDPKVMHTDTSSEYWFQSRSSLIDTDEDVTVDLVQPDNVRRYAFASLAHNKNKGEPPTHGLGDRQCQQLSNPIHKGVVARALIVALHQWVRDGIPPPDSRVPRIDNGTLVTAAQYCSDFVRIPGVACNGLFNASGERDFGPQVSGNRGIITNLIPDVLSVHRVLVPKADEIGNDIAGIRHPFIEAPVATFTGWSLRTPEFTDGDICGINGMMIPLPRTHEEASKTGDPRVSLEELYGDHAGYVRAVANAALNLWTQRLMLLEDVFQTIREADESDVLR